MEADSDKTGVGASRRQSPRHATRLVVKTHRKVPGPCGGILVAGVVIQQRVCDQLNWQTASERSGLERMTQITLQKVLWSLLDLLQHIEQIELAAYPRTLDRLGALALLVGRLSLDRPDLVKHTLGNAHQDDIGSVEIARCQAGVSIRIEIDNALKGTIGIALQRVCKVVISLRRQ